MCAAQAQTVQADSIVGYLDGKIVLRTEAGMDTLKVSECMDRNARLPKEEELKANRAILNAMKRREP